MKLENPYGGDPTEGSGVRSNAFVPAPTAPHRCVDGEHVFSSWSDKGAGLRTFTLNDDGSLDGTYFGNTKTRMSEVLQGGSAKMTGMYRIVNAAYGDGSAYRGTASITLKNDIYQVSYQITDNEGRESFMAYGLRADNMLGVAIHGGGPFGFAHYRIAEDGTLTGKNGWSDAATAGVGKETLKKWRFLVSFVGLCRPRIT